MNICDSNHDEVVYECRYCPACALDAELQEVRAKLEEVRVELRDTYDTLNSYEADFVEWKSVKDRLTNE